MANHTNNQNQNQKQITMTICSECGKIKNSNISVYHTIDSASYCGSCGAALFTPPQDYKNNYQAHSIKSSTTKITKEEK